MRSLIPFISESSSKYLRSLVKHLPDKIYSVEIKIRSSPKAPATTSGPGTVNLSSSADPTSGKTPDQSVLSSLPENLKGSSDARISQDPADSSPRSSKGAQSSKRNNHVDDVQSSYTQVIDRTRRLVRSLTYNSNLISKPTLPTLLSLNASLKELNKHIEKHPESSNLVIREHVIPKLLQIRELAQSNITKPGASKASPKTNPSPSVLNESPYMHLKENSRRALSLLGYTDPPKGRGIKILSIDGGGTRGLVVIEILRQIEKECGKPIHELFDLICGVSTGAIITMLLGALRMPLDEVEAFYRQVSSYLFKTDFLRGTGRLLWSHAYYDTAVWEKILKEIYGDRVMIDTRRSEDCPHVVAISAIVNLPTLQPYLFRNYELHPSSKPLSHFEGSSSHQIWQGVRASAAAPGYFEEFTVNQHVHQDGGILLNNPTAVAVHEAKLLWPNESIQCVLSLGSGRYQPKVSFDQESTTTTATLSSLKHKLLRLIDSATDTEMVHRLMIDLLPENTYYRINPWLRDQANIDENRPEKLEAMTVDAQMYLRRNDYKFKRAIEQLSLERSLAQTMVDTIKYKSSLYL